MSVGYQEIKIGLLSGYIDPHANLVVRSIDNYGDATNNAGANWDPGYWAYGRESDGDRQIPLYRVSLAALPRRVKIADARFVCVVSGKLAPVGYSYTGWPIELHEIEGSLASGTTALLRSTGVPWYGGGYGPRPGYDYVAEAAGSYTPTTTEWNALNNAEPPVTENRTPFEIPCSAALQRAANRRAGGGSGYFEFLLFPGWAHTGAGHIRYYLPHPTSSVYLNPYLWIRYWDKLGVTGVNEEDEDRGADFTKIHNPAQAGPNYRTDLDVVEEGTAGSPSKYWGWNFDDVGPRTNVVAGTGRSEPTTVDNSGSVSGETLQSVDTYDRDTGEWTPAGDYVIRVVDGTHYSVDYTDSAGVTTELLETGTGEDEVTFAADHTFENPSGTIALTIRTLKFSATTGWNAADRLRFSVRADRRTTESVDTPGLVRLCPPTSLPFGDTADTTTGRLVRNAYTQQLRAAAYNEDISGTSRGHLPVRDTSMTDWATGDDAWVEIFTANGATVARGVKIIATFPSDDPDYPDTLRLDRDLTGPELAAFNATASVTAGVYLGNFAKFQVRRLNGPAAAEQNQIVLDEPFDSPPGEMQLVSIAGASEIVTRASGTTTITLEDDLANTYPDESLVFLIVDPGVSPSAMAGRPYFVFGDVPADQLEGLYRGWYRLFEHRVKST